MTTQRPLDRFETELLGELRSVVARAGAPTSPRRPAWRRPAIWIGATAAAAAAVLLATSGIGPGGTSPASATDVLLDTARQAESVPSDDDQVQELVSAGSSVYWHVLFIDSVDEGTVDRTVDTESWEREDGTLWLAEDGGPARQVDGSSYGLCAEEVDLATLRALPSDAGTLRAALEDLAVPDDGHAVPAAMLDSFVTACTIDLLTMPVSSAVRGAAYRSLAALPDTENLGPTTDRQGRTGIELVFHNDMGSQHILVDPDSGELLQFDLAGIKGERQRTVVEKRWTSTAPR